jgi:hypothetical protein
MKCGAVIFVLFLCGCVYAPMESPPATGPPAPSSTTELSTDAYVPTVSTLANITTPEQTQVSSTTATLEAITTTTLSDRLNASQCRSMREDISRQISSMNYCQRDSDCQPISFYCDFGCRNLKNTKARTAGIKSAIDGYVKLCGCPETSPCLASSPTDALSCVEGHCQDESNPPTTSTLNSCSLQRQKAMVIIDAANHCEMDTDCIATSVWLCSELINRGEDQERLHTSIRGIIQAYPCSFAYVCSAAPTPGFIRCLEGKCQDTRSPDQMKAAQTVIY